MLVHTAVTSVRESSWKNGKDLFWFVVTLLHCHPWSFSESEHYGGEGVGVPSRSFQGSQERVGEGCGTLPPHE